MWVKHGAVEQRRGSQLGKIEFELGLQISKFCAFGLLRLAEKFIEEIIVGALLFLDIGDGRLLEMLEDGFVNGFRLHILDLPHTLALGFLLLWHDIAGNDAWVLELLQTLHVSQDISAFPFLNGPLW